MRKTFNSLLAFAMIICILMTTAAVASASETSSQSGIEATLSTDKDAYSSGEDINVTVVVKNTNSYAMNDLGITVELPEEFILKSGDLSISDADIAAGNTLSKKVVATTIDPSDIPKTGDSFNILLWVMLMAVSAAGLFLTVKFKKTATKFWSLFLCVVIVGSTVPTKAFAEETESITLLHVNKTVTVNEKKYEVKASVSLSGSSDVDTDGDGVSDLLEQLLGLDSAKEDTDGDGLTDFQELTIVGTDPKIYDTDKDGISDAQDDEDKDGISNIEEIALGTIVIAADSDFDELSDGDEVKRYKTNPLLFDTDGDTLSDSEEIRIGLDPTKSSTDGKTPDNRRVFSQSVSNEVKDPTLLASDNWLNPSISGNVNGDIASRVKLQASDNHAFDDNRSVLSDVIDISTSYTSPLTLAFSYNKDYTGDSRNLTIASFDDVNGLQVVDTVVDETAKRIYGDITGSSTYFVIDLDEFLKGLGIDVFGNIQSSRSTRAFSLESDATAQLSTAEVLDNDGNVIDTVTFPAEDENPPMARARTLFSTRASGGATGKADIVFVIDVTGSMRNAINNVKNNINTFAKKLAEDYNIDANFGLVEFQDITYDGLDSTVRHKNMSSNWFTNVNTYRNEINGLRLGDGGDIPETPIDGLENARRMDWRSDATKFIVLVTDTYYKNDNSYGIKSMDAMTGLLVNDGIITSVISSRESYYSALIERTDGLYGNIYGSFSDILLGLADKIGEVTNEGEWVFLSDFQAVRLAPKGSANYGDTDGDTVKDYDELGTKRKWDMFSYISRLTNRHSIPAELYTGKRSIDVYDYKSNPVMYDTDYDGFPDGEDETPRKWTFSTRDMAIASGLAYSNLEPGTKIENSSFSLDNGASVKEMKGWTVEAKHKGGAGYYAIALKKDNSIVLAYRGSTAHNPIDAIDDWVFADIINVFTGLSTQAPAAKQFAEYMVKNYPNYNFYICGHSLGGNLALNGAANALLIKPDKITNVITFNGLGMPAMGILHEFYTGDFGTLMRYAERFYDLEIKGDPVSWFETKPDHKWWEFDVAVTLGFGNRVVYPKLVGDDAHSLENFYRQQIDEQELYNRPPRSSGGGSMGGR